MTRSEAERRFRDEVADIRSAIFYWMTRNHHRGEKSYAELGNAKERLTAALKAYDDAVNAIPADDGGRG